MTEKRTRRPSVFKKPEQGLPIIVSVRLTQQDVDLVNDLIERTGQSASNVIRAAIRGYAENKAA